MGFFKRILGLPVTAVPADDECWRVDGRTVRLALDRAPELGAPGGAVRLEGKGLDPRLLVLHGVDGVYRAYSNNCACSGWRVDPVRGEQKVKCCTPAGSTYDYEGKRLSGPAKEHLSTFPVRVEGGELEIDLG